VAASPLAVANHPCVATTSGEACLRRHHQWRSTPASPPPVARLAWSSKKMLKTLKKCSKQQLVSKFITNT
jgi:hypothetical protein